MSEILHWVQACETEILTAFFGSMLLIVLISQFRLLHRVRKMHKKMDQITDAVRDYLSVVMEEDEQSQESEEIKRYAVGAQMRKDEEETRIISSVLQEIFP